MNIKIMGPSGVTKLKDEAKKNVEKADLRKNLNATTHDFRQNKNNELKK